MIGIYEGDWLGLFVKGDKLKMYWGTCARPNTWMDED